MKNALFTLTMLISLNVFAGFRGGDSVTSVHAGGHDPQSGRVIDSFRQYVGNLPAPSLAGLTVSQEACGDFLVLSADRAEQVIGLQNLISNLSPDRSRPTQIVQVVDFSGQETATGRAVWALFVVPGLKDLSYNAREQWLGSLSLAQGVTLHSCVLEQGVRNTWTY